MNGNPRTIIRQLREPVPTRRLEDHEGRYVAERQATKCLELFGLGGPPVDVGLIAELPRVEVVAKTTQQIGGLSGFSEYSRGRWHIAVNSDDQPTRRRFTLAHEFKHVLDHPFVGVIYRDAQGKPSDERAERMCDYFAACLLMPRVWVKRAWGDGINDQRALAALFDVSPTAMAIRLEQLGLTAPRQRHRQTPSQFQRYLRPGLVVAA
jgi:Zn-dependent peptidase ImmA (M78 family)